MSVAFQSYVTPSSINPVENFQATLLSKETEEVKSVASELDSIAKRNDTLTILQRNYQMRSYQEQRYRKKASRMLLPHTGNFVNRFI
jgi:GH35 family endo-1,4-beta-xylanase